MGLVKYNGVNQEYHLLLPYQKMQVEEQQARDLAAKRPVIADSDLALRALPLESKLAMRRAGYQGDLSEPPPGPNSGKLGTTITKSQAGHVVQEYTGDSRAWMNQFAPPVKMEMLAIRGPNQSDGEWQQVMERRFDHWQARNPDKKGDNPTRLMMK